ncbi:hypothetical protein FRC06_007882, partial [Ceratobasidium sp. 370]
MSTNPPLSTQHHKITALKGKENYMLWKVQLCNILFELDLETYIDPAAIAQQQQLVAAASAASTSSTAATT